MKFQKDGIVYDVTDKAHIDCFKAKGWEMVKEQKEQTEEQKLRNKK